MILGVALGLATTVFVPLLLLGSHRISIWPAIVGYHAYCVIAPRAFGRSPTKGGWNSRVRPSWLVGSVVVSSMAILGAFVLRPWIVEQFDLPDGTYGLLTPWWLFLAYSLCINPFIEESFWRDFVLERTGVLISSVPFWLVHFNALLVLLPWRLAALLSFGPLIAGLAWGWTRKYSGNIWPCVITHWAIDAAILWMIQGLREI